MSSQVNIQNQIKLQESTLNRKKTFTELHF